MADCITSNGVASMMANRNPDSNSASSVSIVVQVRSIYLVYLCVSTYLFCFAEWFFCYGFYVVARVFTECAWGFVCCRFLSWSELAPLLVSRKCLQVFSTSVMLAIWDAAMQFIFFSFLCATKWKETLLNYSPKSLLAVPEEISIYVLLGLKAGQCRSSWDVTEDGDRW